MFDADLIAIMAEEENKNEMKEEVKDDTTDVSVPFHLLGIIAIFCSS